MTLNLHMPQQAPSLRPIITVVGVGGAGGNAVNNMIADKLEGVQFVVANTDAQALESALTDRAIQLGASVTQGLGAGASPDVGQASAEEALEEIAGHIEGSNMVFITAGMGGGTGTGAAPVVARLARDNGILTVGVVTKPFQFEGANRMRIADEGITELQKYVDTLIVIPNQNLFRVANEKTTFADAFRMADEVLHSGVRGVTDLMVKPGLVNLDFADIRAVMREMGKAMMGTGEASGEGRATAASEAAISNPLLDDVSLKGARAALINITGGNDMTLFEVDEAANRIREEIDADANIIFGSTFNDALEGSIRVSVVATGIEGEEGVAADPNVAANRSVVSNHRPKFPYAPAGRPAAKPASESSNAAADKEPKTQEKSGMTIKAQQKYTPGFNMSRPSPAAAKPAMAPAAPQPSGQEEAYHAVQEDMAIITNEEELRAGQHESEDHGPLFGAPHEESQVGAYDEDDEPASIATGIMNRLKSAGKAISAVTQHDEQTESYEQEPVQHAPRRIEIQHAPERQEQAHQEEDYEIPAFLRRQAN